MNDRGTKKWTSLMLPEQVVALKVLWEEQTYKVMPTLDMQQIEENNYQLQQALQLKRPVQVTYFREGNYQTEKGRISRATNEAIVINERKIVYDHILQIEIERV